MRDDHEDRHDRTRRAATSISASPVNHERGAGLRGAARRGCCAGGGQIPPRPDKAPDGEAEPHDEDAQRDLFLGGHRQESEEPEQAPAALLAEVECKEEPRGDQRDHVELPHVFATSSPGNKQIDGSEGDAGQMALQTIARQPEDGQRAQRQEDRLQDQDGFRLLPQRVDWRQDEVDRLDVHRQPAVVGQVQLDPAPVGELQRPACTVYKNAWLTLPRS